MGVIKAGMRIEDLKVLSAGRSCVISYNNHQTDELMSLDKARRIFNHLMNDTNRHLTPTEHQARHLTEYENSEVNDIKRACKSRKKARQAEYFSNFRGWISHRYELETEL